MSEPFRRWERLGWVLVVLAGWFVPLGAVSAEPERVVLKTAAARSEEKAARKNLRQIDLRGIQDPEARMAIREILRYLRLNPKK